jgi:hypothetical protein
MGKEEKDKKPSQISIRNIPSALGLISNFKMPIYFLTCRSSHEQKVWIPNMI